MTDLAGTVAAAAGVFAGTNIDDLIVLTVLFLAASTAGKPRPWQIWVGQYAGIGALVAIAGAAALGLTLLPDRWVGLLGLIPLALGVRGLIAAVRSPGDAAPPVASGLVSVAAVTMANGADNIAVYTPVFRTIGVVDTLITIAVFAVLVAVWCLAASWLGGHRRVIVLLGRFGHWLVPLVFVAIGLVILSGLF
ncbi:cadmium transporter [Asanoa ishikariensis]|uniref:Cadmium resistance protein CadD, predicted permease n=1 Tax=Asanoa ishikariensis TaxID=137265 RepID=A0A1H3TK01_9ACTN|nr:cadmium resistance transporter [Asanoa ishikariensis]GIF62300.1 cadmium transporter [Asanoa ishikariensis]SDZ50440.1 Cadmium resistance protein CadD, predicted permease [Asanoa ishikariensis]